MFKKNNYNHLNNLNKLNPDIHYKKNENIESYILKIFYNKYLFEKELYMYSVLKKICLNIVPNIINVDNSKQIIEYNCTNLTPLRIVLQSYNINSHFIINELLSFIKSIQFKKISFGNLHIDNIYININTMKFYILNICNITFVNSEYDLDKDLKLLYHSLCDINIKNKILLYIKQEIDNYIKKNKLHDLIDLIDLYCD